MIETDSRFAKHMEAQSRDGLNDYRDTNHDIMARLKNGTTKEFHSWATNPFLIIGVFPIPHEKQLGLL